jgi:hypothetical protein
MTVNEKIQTLKISMGITNRPSSKKEKKKQLVPDKHSDKDRLSCDLLSG